MNSAADVSAPRVCPNCDAALGGRFCGACGQENPVEHGYTVRSFLRETWQEFRGRASTGKTLYVLLTRPGALTEAFVRGQRIRYVNPVKLFVACLSVSAVISAFFAPEEQALAEMQAAMPEFDPADVRAVFPWAFGAAKLAWYAAYTSGMAALAALLRGMLSGRGRQPLADVIFPLHFFSLVLLVETAMSLLFRPLELLGMFLGIASTILLVTTWFFVALRRAYALGLPDATRVTLVATLLFAPAYLVSLLLQLMVVVLVFVPLMLLVLWPAEGGW